MSRYLLAPRKRSLSAHQKQIRFFTRLAMVICSLLALVVFWLLSRPSYLVR